MLFLVEKNSLLKFKPVERVERHWPFFIGAENLPTADPLIDKQIQRDRKKREDKKRQARYSPVGSRVAPELHRVALHLPVREAAMERNDGFGEKCHTMLFILDYR